MDDGDNNLEVYQTLRSDELEVEVLPVTAGRARVASQATVGPPIIDEFIEPSDEEMEEVRIVLCDAAGPGGRGYESGNMAFYLQRQWDRSRQGSQASGNLQAGDIVPFQPGSAEASTISLARQSSTAEIIAQDDSVESVMSRVEFGMDNCEMADTPWRVPGANLQEYFNFNQDEKQFKDYVMKQVRMRLEARKRVKIDVANGHSTRN
mmetsp:Transcript_100264/g.164808  ORF Transcript_100264/g.164808 Transcript_100264/m.164808 type:complete len:207 (+) Transcript_100264:121-741(+)